MSNLPPLLRSEFMLKKLPTTTPSTTPINDSKYEDSDDEGIGSSPGISNMVLMKEVRKKSRPNPTTSVANPSDARKKQLLSQDYNDYDDAGDSTSEDEGEFEDDGVDR